MADARQKAGGSEREQDGSDGGHRLMSFMPLITS